MGAAVQRLVASGTLLPEEADLLVVLPDRSSVVVGWLAAFWEEVLGRSSEVACAAAFEKKTVDNGRYSLVFGKLAAARDAINLCHMCNPPPPPTPRTPRARDVRHAGAHHAGAC